MKLPMTPPSLCSGSDDIAACMGLVPIYACNQYSGYVILSTRAADTESEQSLLCYSGYSIQFISSPQFSVRVVVFFHAQRRCSGRVVPRSGILVG